MRMIKPSEIASIRLHNQQFISTRLASAAQMVHCLGAVQGQEYALSKWSLGLRLPHLKDIDIEQELQEGKILRTHLLRPTWHFVAAEDIRWLLALTAPQVHKMNGFMYRQTGLDPPTLKRCKTIISKTLRDGKSMTRTQLNQVFHKNGIEASGHRLSYIMMYAELEGLICSGPRQGNQFTYALLEERVPKQHVLKRSEAILNLTTRYFQSRGPATVKDYATWSGLSISDCKHGIDGIAEDLTSFSVEGHVYYLMKDHHTEVPSKKMYLLPVYDEMIMGYKDRSAYMEVRKGLSKPQEFAFQSTMMYDGQIIGTWKRTTGKKSIDLEYSTFGNLNPKQRAALDTALARFQDFNALPVVVKHRR